MSDSFQVVEIYSYGEK